MDYMVLCALFGITLTRIVISYDIGCQWSKKFSKRMEEYPENMKLAPDTKLEIGIPNWHVNGHGAFCRNNYSLNYKKGVGKTSGEDVEITWSHTNSLAPATREMGPGARRETLNDHWNGWNFCKLVGLRMFFLRIIPVCLSAYILSRPSMSQTIQGCSGDAKETARCVRFLLRNLPTANRAEVDKDG